MIRVIIESPFQGTGPWPLRVFRQWANVRYARRCMLDSLQRGEAPFLSHLLYPQVLKDKKPKERMQGIMVGLAIGELMELTTVYYDRGIASGMDIGINTAQEEGRPVAYRSLKKAGKDAPGCNPL